MRSTHDQYRDAWTEERLWLKRSKRVIRALLRAVPEGSVMEENLIKEITDAETFLRREKNR